MTAQLTEPQTSILQLVNLFPFVNAPPRKEFRKDRSAESGFALSTGQIVIVQDADREYDPIDIPGVILPILEGRADVVYGSRFLVRRATRVLYFYHYLPIKVSRFSPTCLRTST
jgi:hypothetical protein